MKGKYFAKVSQNLIDWSRTMGVKNQTGRIIINSSSKTNNVAERFFDFIILFNLLYNGLNINAKINPIIMDMSIGLRRRKDKTIRTAKIRVVVIYLKYFSSAMFLLVSWNL